MSEKMWGGEPFWGLGYDWDPDWVLTDRQKELRATLIELCEKELRANAKRSDDELLFPRRNLELLGEHGFLGLIVPEEYGGLGENHVGFAMTCETIARYGCASTAMCYVMHIGAVDAIMFRPTPELIDKYIRPLNSGTIGTLSYSDPETGSHFWYPSSSGPSAQRRVQGPQEGVVDDLRRASPTSTSCRRRARTSRATTTSPSSSSTRSTARRSRRSGTRSGYAATSPAPSRVHGRRDPGEQLVGPEGDGATSNDEVGRPVVPHRLVVGVERHRVRRDRHRETPHDAQAARRRRDARGRLPDDPGLRRRGGHGHERRRACSSTPSRRRWTARPTTTRSCSGQERSRARNYLHWAWQIKFVAAKNVAHVVDKMLHACGGSGYKRDMELERYLRDAKAGWVMGPTNEVLRQFVGKAVLLGFDALDYWNQSYNRRAVENEVKKLDADGKRELAEKLMAEAAEMEAKAPASA